MATETWQQEIADGKRYGFGRNWRGYLRLIDADRIASARSSLSGMLRAEDLSGRSFLDIGCGSGLFSLAAHQMGARVRSFDFDPDSVACCEELKRRYGRSGSEWVISAGSVLDPSFLNSLGTFDIVYSWGVLHHTGSMWRAIELAGERCRAGGELFIAIYNDCGKRSRQWLAVKKLYNRTPGLLRPLILYPIAGAKRLNYIRKRSARREQGAAEAKIARGMSWWYDTRDWIGGYPYEFASPAAIEEFLTGRGFSMRELVARNGKGCNEFLFVNTGLAGVRGE